MKHFPLDEILDAIPAYPAFLSLAELEASSEELVQAYPERVCLEKIGESQSGLPLRVLRVGRGERKILFNACPHPNEPIGSMTIEHLSSWLAAHPEVLEAWDASFYFVKAWDCDGLRRNEGWLKGPFTVSHYARHFYRPASRMQVDWTFPIDYKRLHFHDSLPETRAMMNLIDEIKPLCIYSLHNAGFGGAYWYVTEDIPELYPLFYELVKESGIPRHDGDPEAPYLKTLSPAVYLAEGISESYDYLESNGVEKPEEVLGGSSSDDYAGRLYGSFTLVTELPYFYDARIADNRLSQSSKRECALKRLAASEESRLWLLSRMERLRDFFAADNPYILALIDFNKAENLEAERQDVLQHPRYEAPAKNSELFDNLEIHAFYQLLQYGMWLRAFEEESRQTEESAALYKEAEEVFKAKAADLEARLNYQAIPIEKLVRLQLGCGLIMLRHFFGT